MQNKVELLTNGIIYIERHGSQTEHALNVLYEQASTLAVQLRRQGKPVLVLANHAYDAPVSVRILARLIDFDLDRVAVYGTAPHISSKRDLMVRASGIEGKIASFKTKDEALKWLLSER